MEGWRDFFSKDNGLQPYYAMNPSPDARRGLAECVFISHSGADMHTIKSDLVDPFIRVRKGPNGYFFFNAGFGGREGYQQFVLLAMYMCRYAIVVVSKNSQSNPWVMAEVDWLLDHRRPIATYLLDDTPPSSVHPRLGEESMYPSEVKWFDRTHVNELVRWIDLIDPEAAKRIIVNSFDKVNAWVRAKEIFGWKRKKVGPEPRPSIAIMFEQLDEACHNLIQLDQPGKDETQRLLAIIDDLRWYADRIGDERLSKMPRSYRWSFEQNLWHLTQQVKQATAPVPNRVLYFIDRGKECIGIASETFALFEHDESQ